METIKLKWVKNANKITIEADDVTTKIEIDDVKKEVQNAKKFFREAIFSIFYNNWDKRIELIDNEDLEINEIKVLINELVAICNDEIEKLKSVTHDDVVQDELGV